MTPHALAALTITYIKSIITEILKHPKPWRLNDSPINETNTTNRLPKSHILYIHNEKGIQMIHKKCSSFIYNFGHKSRSVPTNIKKFYIYSIYNRINPIKEVQRLLFLSYEYQTKISFNKLKYHQNSMSKVQKITNNVQK